VLDFNLASLRLTQAIQNTSSNSNQNKKVSDILKRYSLPYDQNSIWWFTKDSIYIMPHGRAYIIRKGKVSRTYKAGCCSCEMSLGVNVVDNSHDAYEADEH
jgi:hypothetical protein